MGKIKKRHITFISYREKKGNILSILQPGGVSPVVPCGKEKRELTRRGRRETPWREKNSLLF